MSEINNKFNWFNTILNGGNSNKTTNSKNSSTDFSSIFGDTTSENGNNDYSFDSFTPSSNTLAKNNDYRNSAISDIDSATKKQLGDDCYSSTSTLSQLSTEDLAKMQKYMSQGTNVINLNGMDANDIKNKLQTADQNSLMTTPDKDGKTLTEKFIEAYKKANNGQDPQVKDENGHSAYDDFYWSADPQKEIDNLGKNTKTTQTET